VDADRVKVAVNPHRVRAEDRLVRVLDKLAQVEGRHELVALRAVVQLANRRVAQVVVLLLCQLRRSIVPVAVAAKFSKPFVVSLSNHMQHQYSLRQADITTGEITSHLTKPPRRQVIGYSHSTRLSKYDNPVAGYQGERSNGFSE
jgi:hypothetical protein